MRAVALGSVQVQRTGERASPVALKVCCTSDLTKMQLLWRLLCSPSSSQHFVL
jgi:hypothetical protein